MPQLQTSSPTDFSNQLTDILTENLGKPGQQLSQLNEQGSRMLRGSATPEDEQGFISGMLGVLPMGGLTAEGRPSTLKELVTELRNKGQGLRLDNMIATLRNPSTGHEIEGRFGVAGHNYDKLMAYLQSIGARPDMQSQYERSFKIPGQGGLTIPDWAANQLRSVPFVENLFNLYKMGRTDDQVMRLMQSLLPSDIQRFRRGG